MFGTHFYNEGIRRLTIGFGQLFNNVIVQNKSSTGAVTKRYRVPLAYAPKEKFLVRLDEQANLEDREFAVTLPRMGFEMTGLSYDSSREIKQNAKIQTELRPVKMVKLWIIIILLFRTMSIIPLIFYGNC